MTIRLTPTWKSETPVNENDETAIPDDADEDIPFPPSASTDEDASANNGLPTPKKIDPRENHEFGVEDFKNNAAVSFLLVCVIAISILSIIGACKGDVKDISSAIETLKTLATVAVGFLFANVTKKN